MSLGPLIAFTTSQDMNVILQVEVASFPILMSSSVIHLVNWVVSPYVHKIRWQPGSDSFEVEMLSSWLATSIPRTIRFVDIRPAKTGLPFVSFEANGTFYFVDAEHCHNKALLAKLTPQKASQESEMKMMRRLASSAAERDDDNRISIGPQGSGEDEDDDAGVAYRAPMSYRIRRMRVLSLATCYLVLTVNPLSTLMTSQDVNMVLKGVASVWTLMTSQDMNMILKGVAYSSVIFFPTAALHWFTNPYVHEIRWQPGSDSFVVELLSWKAKPILITLKFADIRPAETNRPFVSFKAKGNFYFVDEEHCDNKELLAKLTPQKATED